MIPNFIKEANQLNRIDVSLVKGKRMYYNKIRNVISLIAAVSFYVLMVIFSLSMEKGKELPLILCCLFGIFMILYILDKAGMLLLKNPLFILQGEKIYYLRTNEWYPIMDYDFRDEYIGKHNYYATFCMFNKKGERIIAEKNWHLKNEEEFKSHIKYNKLLLTKNNR